jgi:hypothetical protein
VTIGHRQGHPVRFAIILLDANGQKLASTEITAMAGQTLPWSLAVPGALTGPVNLFISTRMAEPTDTTQFAWATLVDPIIERPTLASLP